MYNIRIYIGYDQIEKEKKKKNKTAGCFMKICWQTERKTRDLAILWTFFHHFNQSPFFSNVSNVFFFINFFFFQIVQIFHCLSQFSTSLFFFFLFCLHLFVYSLFFIFLSLALSIYFSLFLFFFKL